MFEKSKKTVKSIGLVGFVIVLTMINKQANAQNTQDNDLLYSCMCIMFSKWDVEKPERYELNEQQCKEKNDELQKENTGKCGFILNGEVYQ